MMLYCSSIRVAAFSAMLLMDIASATAHDETKYPDLRGQWTAVGGSVNYVPGKPRGRGQEAPLTPEYQAIFEANLKDGILTVTLEKAEKAQPSKKIAVMAA